VAADREAVAVIVTGVGNFSPEEIQCALELVDIYLGNPEQKDYHAVVAENALGVVSGYACWGPTPMTQGTFDLYWIATRPGAQGQGTGRALMNYVESEVQQRAGRLLVIETSSKDSYAGAVRFYRRLGYQESARIVDFYHPGDDRLIFVKRFRP